MAIGIHTEVKSLPLASLYARAGRPHEPFDLAHGWLADYPDPDDFLSSRMGCQT